MSTDRALTIANLVALSSLLVIVLIATGPGPPRNYPLFDGNRDWMRGLERADTALEDGNRGAAVRGWQQAYYAARASRQWDAMVAVGDAALRQSWSPTAPAAGKAKARRAYLAALFMARSQGSVAGSLRAAEAFAAIGDLEMAQRALHLARELPAAGDHETREGIELVAARLSVLPSPPVADPTGGGIGDQP
jgi:hypothetical protein